MEQYSVLSSQWLQEYLNGIPFQKNPLKFADLTFTSQIEVKNLVVRLKAGEKSAFTDLYTHYSDALYGVIKKVLRSEESDGDVLQDSFVKIWKNIDKYDESKGFFFTWMLNICINTSIDKLTIND